MWTPGNGIARSSDWSQSCFVVHRRRPRRWKRSAAFAIRWPPVRSPSNCSHHARTAHRADALRLLWVRLLGQFRNVVSVEALVRAGLEESDETVREAALNELVEYGSGSAVATYLQYLSSNDNQLVNRAARALTWFPDRELVLTYIDALVTTHKTELAPGPGMQVGFGSGGGGMQMGGKKQVQVDQVKNPAALTLVKSVVPDVDYGYDEQAWKNYIASLRTAFSGDLRRDP